MKRIILTLAVMLSLVSISFAADEEKVSAAVLQSFHSSFKQAKEVDWTVKENLYKAQFNLDGQYITVFYNLEGKMLGMTRNLAVQQLPIGLQTSLRNQVEGTWISELFEVSNEDGTTYYVTLENADTKQVLKSSGSGEWTSFQKLRKS
jgi:hypothetical protein